MAIDAEKKAKVLKYRWVVFVTLAIAYFFVYFHRTTGGAISGEMQDWFSITKSEVGMLASAYLWAYTLMQIPSGILTDKMGPRKAATIFILLLAAGSVLCAVSSLESIKSYPLMWVGKFVIGIGAAVIYIPIMKVLAVWFRKNEFASMSGILLLVGNVGGIAAATPMVMLIQNLGFADTYFILTGITVVIGILTWLFVRNHPNEMDLPGIEEIVSEETGEPIKESTSAKMGTKEALKLTFTSGRKFWPLAIWFFFMYGTIMLWQASQAGSFYKDIGGLPSDTYAMFITMVGVGMVVGCPLAGRLSDKVLKSRKKVIIIGPTESQRSSIDTAYRSKVRFISEESLLTEDGWKGFYNMHLKDPVYISLDKDVLDEGSAITDWDQGVVTLSDLLRLLDIIFKNEKVIGMDICGEYSGAYDLIKAQKAGLLNEETNGEILEEVARDALS